MCVYVCVCVCVYVCVCVCVCITSKLWQHATSKQAIDALPPPLAHTAAVGLAKYVLSMVLSSIEDVVRKRTRAHANAFTRRPHSQQAVGRRTKKS
jgi:TRAP-type C4-dicarboxylate transport system permease small subunit